MYSSNASYSSMTRSAAQNSMTAKEIQNMMDDDNSSTSASTSTISSASNDLEDDDASLVSSDSENEGFVDRIEAFAVQGNTPALAQLVFDADFLVANTKNKRTTNSSVASLRSNLSLMDYVAPPNNDTTNLLTAEEIAKMLLQSRPTPVNGAGSAGRGNVRRSVSETFLSKGYLTVGPSTSSDNVSLSSKKSTASGKRNVAPNTKPWDFLGTLLADHGIPHASVPYTEVPVGFFLKLESKHFTAYDSEIARATRVGDLAVVQARYRSNKSLLSCNRFKETIIHTICRRGHVNLLDFIVNETDIPIQVVDDLGRNPIHDACWTHKPNFELVKLLVKTSPDLLYIADNRGFTPLDYIGKGCWGEWCNFLNDNQEMIVPRELLVNDVPTF
jgi:hypothetical protein